MESMEIAAGRWPVSRRARVRVRLCRYVVVGRVARVSPRAAGPPGRWGLCVVGGRLGYGLRHENGRVAHWRPLREG